MLLYDVHKTSLEMTRKDQGARDVRSIQVLSSEEAGHGLKLLSYSKPLNRSFSGLKWSMGIYYNALLVLALRQFP